MNSTTRGALEMGSAMTLSGSIGYFVLMTGLPPIDVVFWRCAFGLLALLGLCAALRLWRRPTRLEWAYAGLGGGAIVLNWVLLFGAYRHASVAVATAVYNLQPFMLMGLGMAFLGERPGTARLAWLTLAFGGVLLIARDHPDAAYVEGHFGLGLVLALGAAALWALAALLTKRLAGLPAPLIALVHCAIGLLLLGPFTGTPSSTIGPTTWSALMVLGVVHTGVMYALMYAGVQRLTTALQGALSFLYPVTAIAVDALALGHTLTPLQWAGSAAILASAAGMLYATRRA